MIVETSKEKFLWIVSPRSLRKELTKRIGTGGHYVGWGEWLDRCCKLEYGQSNGQASVHGRMSSPYVIDDVGHFKLSSPVVDSFCEFIGERVSRGNPTWLISSYTRDEFCTLALDNAKGKRAEIMVLAKHLSRFKEANV